MSDNWSVPLRRKPMRPVPSTSGRATLASSRTEHPYLTEDHAPVAAHFERLLRLLHLERNRNDEALAIHAPLHLSDGDDGRVAVVCESCHTSYPCSTRRALTGVPE